MRPIAGVRERQLSGEAEAVAGCGCANQDAIAEVSAVPRNQISMIAKRFVVILVSRRNSLQSILAQACLAHLSR